MTPFTTILKRLLKRKLATAVLITASVAAFATLGDGGKKGTKSSASSATLGQRNFSLKTGHNYRGNNLFSNTKSKNYIVLNTVVTYHKGNATYILPLKKKVLLNKVKFTPSKP